MSDAKSEIGRLRLQIDEVDRELVDLLRRRVLLVVRVARLKRDLGVAVYDPARERELVDRVPHGRVRALYQLVVESCRRHAQAAVPRPVDDGD